MIVPEKIVCCNRFVSSYYIDLWKEIKFNYTFYLKRIYDLISYRYSGFKTEKFHFNLSKAFLSYIYEYFAFYCLTFYRQRGICGSVFFFIFERREDWNLRRLSARTRRLEEIVDIYRSRKITKPRSGKLKTGLWVMKHSSTRLWGAELEHRCF